MGGGHGLFSQFAHLVGNHSEASPRISGPCRLNGGVQGQQIGLICNIPDNSQNFAYAAGLRIQRMHTFLQRQ